ncbi:MAG TPA: bifunctional phosphopantothenoylcysteine decarboxylase/phosphopantothenate--cysteine ligase CoaBC [Thermoanaerobacterales bacterium]|jgi:phosphopantothenoylcysteine decarboxylase/phosphopantothenate--cysteine ligase|nr:bifunctional phosphopantothenoylcysteine decarboxylase/phosphopantothenate--cysteine ligase CoaBC [Thermoanaerobacterales bacterium]
MLHGKSVVIGVTGSIAAYKAVELVRLLKKSEANVKVVMTDSACEFIRPLTFQVVSQNPVVTSMFNEPSHWEVEHVSIADEADIFVVAPATANIIAKLAYGIADDMLTSTVLATKAKKLIVPAMNVNMYENPVTQRNLEILVDMGFEIMDPDEGPLACGYSGKGRFPQPEKIFNKINEMMYETLDFKDKRILITAGPTREPIDPVRFISNHSSGKMGYSIAQIAERRGAQVILVSGPTNLKPPSGLYRFVSVETAQQMYEAVMKDFDQVDVVIKAAAVADYRPKSVSLEKIKKKDTDMCIELERNADILRELGDKKRHQVLVGFAAETENIEKNASDKLNKKNLDMIVVNDVKQQGAGFGYDTNIAKILYKNGRIEALPQMLKTELANKILDRILEMLK